MENGIFNRNWIKGLWFWKILSKVSSKLSELSTLIRKAQFWLRTLIISRLCCSVHLLAGLQHTKEQATKRTEFALPIDIFHVHFPIHYFQSLLPNCLISHNHTTWSSHHKKCSTSVKSKSIQWLTSNKYIIKEIIVIRILSCPKMAVL